MDHLARYRLALPTTSIIKRAVSELSTAWDHVGWVPAQRSLDTLATHELDYTLEYYARVARHGANEVHVNPVSEQNSRLSPHAGDEDVATGDANVVGDGTFASFLEILQNGDREAEERQPIASKAI